ncbi:glucosidase II, partial [Teratosphaeriaceae sp. CCFEE 6253]
AFEAVIKHSPFAVDFKRDGETQIKLNGQGLLNVEHWRAKVDKPVVEKKEGDDEKKEGEEVVVPVAKDENEVDEGTWWDESFGGNTDSKPKGPEAVALDISFPGYKHVFGIAEHAGSLSLKETRGGDGKYTEPYRMYNSD